MPSTTSTPRSPTPPPPAEPRVLNWLEILLKVLGVSVPALYLMGRSYVDAWWRALGLPKLQTYETGDYLYAGFLSILGGTWTLVGDGYIWTLGRAVLVVMILTAWVGVANALLNGLLRLAEWAGRWAPVRQVATTEGWLGRLRKWAVGPLAIGAFTASLLAMVPGLVIILALPAVFAEFAAEREVKQLRRSLAQARAGTPVSVTTSEVAGTKLRLLQCGSDWCVVWQSNRFVAVPTDDVAHLGIAAARPAAASSVVPPAQQGTEAARDARRGPATGTQPTRRASTGAPRATPADANKRHAARGTD